MVAGPEKLHGAAMAADGVAALHARIAQLEADLVHARLHANYEEASYDALAAYWEQGRPHRVPPEPTVGPASDGWRVGDTVWTQTTYYVPERQPGSPCLICGSPWSGHGFAGNCPGT